MRKARYLPFVAIPVLLVFSAGRPCSADVNDPIDTNLVVLAELRDGSRIRGKPTRSQLKLKLDYAEIDLKLDVIKSITFGSNHVATARIRGGDLLSGTLAEESIELATQLGTYAIGVSNIQSIVLLPGGIPEGLVLWNPLDGSPSIVGPNVTFGADQQFVGGRSGDGVRVAGRQQWGMTVDLGDLELAPRGAIEFWMKVIRKPATVSHGSGPRYDLAHVGGDRDSPFHFMYNANDGSAHGKYQLHSGGFIVYTEGYSGSKSTDILGRTGGWMHYGLVWDEKGIPGLGNEKLAIYLDNQKHGHYQDRRRHKAPFANNPTAKMLKLHRNLNGFDSVMVYDELRIWDHARTDFSPKAANYATGTGPVTDGKNMRVRLELTDGSRLIGTVTDSALTVTTRCLGKIEIPFHLVSSFDLKADKETTAIALKNGDIIVGFAGNKGLRIETILGPIEISFGHLVGLAPAGD